jgi:hypothetical protein
MELLVCSLEREDMVWEQPLGWWSYHNQESLQKFKVVGDQNLLILRETEQTKEISNPSHQTAVY